MAAGPYSGRFPKPEVRTEASKPASSIPTLVGPLMDHLLHIETTNEAKKMTIDFISAWYLEEVNRDAIDIRVELYDNEIGQYIYNFFPQNLYTFLLLCGINILYCNWVYDELYVNDGWAYEFNKKTKSCIKKRLNERSEVVAENVVYGSTDITEQQRIDIIKILKETNDGTGS